MKALPWYIVLALAALAGWLFYAAQAAERRVGATVARIAVLEGQRDSLALLAGRLDTVQVTQVRMLTRWRDSTVTLRDSLTITDTVEVVRFIAVQDSTIVACTAALTTCDQRVAVERARNANAERRVTLTKRLVGAPRTAAGLAYDLRTGMVGVSVDRDVGRFRVGGSVTPGGATLGLRFWW